MSNPHSDKSAWYASLQCRDLSLRYIVLPSSASIVTIWCKDGNGCATISQFQAFMEAVRINHPSYHRFLDELIEGIDDWDEKARWYAIDWLVARKLIRIFETREEAAVVGTSMVDPKPRKQYKKRENRVA